MNEQDWLNCDDSIPMLAFLLSGSGAPLDARRRDIVSRSEGNCGAPCWKPTQRKLRLFACACMRRSKVLGGSDRLDAIRTSEQYADELVDQAALEAALIPVRKLPEPIPCDADFVLSVVGPTDMDWETKVIAGLLALGPELDVKAAATLAAEIITEREGAEYLASRGRCERSQQAHLLREIFGNPFRSVEMDTSLLTARTRALAEAIYEEGRFADLPLLAKALTHDAGCTNQDVLDHCEWPIPHVRGCWVVDLALGKS